MRPQPRAVVDALLPDSWRSDVLTLRPLTAGDVLLLEKLKCEVFGDKDSFSPEDIVFASFVLAYPPGEVEHRWQSSANVMLQAVIWAETTKNLPVEQLRSILRGLLAQAFDSCLATRWPNDGYSQAPEANKNGNGLGWVLTAIDALCFSYGWSLEYVKALPLSTVFALLTTRRINNGAEFAEPNFYEREELDDIAKRLGVTTSG